MDNRNAGQQVKWKERVADNGGNGGQVWYVPLLTLRRESRVKPTREEPRRKNRANQGGCIVAPHTS